MRLPLLAGQRAIWLGDRVSGSGTAFLTAQASWIAGPIDAERFREAAERVVAEADCLRLIIQDGEEGPYQEVRESSPFDLPVVDLAAAADPDGEADAWIRAALSQPIDLARRRPFRWALLKIAQARVIWVQIYHHAAIDATGRALVAARLFAIYEALIAGTPPVPSSWPALADVVAAEQAYLNSAACASDREWIGARLRDPPPPPGPFTAVTPAATLAGFRVNRRLEPELAARLQACARNTRITVPQLLCAAWIGLLGRLSLGTDLLIGFQVAGRLGPTRGAVAMLTNTVPVRIDFSADATVAELGGIVAREIREGMRCQRHPQRLAHAAAAIRPTDLDPLAVGFNYAPAPAPLRIAGQSVRTRNLSHGPVRALSLSVEPAADGSLDLDLDANRERYRAAEIEALADRLMCLLRDLARCRPSAAMRRLAVMGDGERRTILEEWAGAEAAPRALTLPDLIPLRTDGTGATLALAVGRATFSYEHLDAASNRLARLLIEKGLGTGDVVAVGLPRGADLVVAMLGIARAGAVFCPLDPGQPAARHARMLAASNARVLIGGRGGITAPPPQSDLPLLDLNGPDCLASLRHMPEGQIADAERRAPLLPEAPAYIVFTSGSTGPPKPVVVSHASITRMLQALSRYLPMSDGEVWFGVMPIVFDGGINDILLPLYQRKTLVLLQEAELRDPGAVSAALWRYPNCTLLGTPSFWRTLPLQELPPGLRAVVGGEAFPTELLPDLRRFRAVVNAYGPTEATIIATLGRVDLEPEPNETAPVGRPLAGYRVWVLDSRRDPVPAGVPGELYIGGAALADGYLGDPELTARRFVFCQRTGERMYRTGDIARWRADGQLEILGRADSQVKVSGYRIEPGEIEHALLALPGIAEAAVVLRTDRSRPSLVAYYVASEAERALTEASVKQSLAGGLPTYMMPGSFVRLPELPRTASGKLDRAALMEVEPPSRPHTPPQSVDEAVLCAAFARICRLPTVGRDDDFFELGATSLDCMMLVSELRRGGHNLSLPLLFEARTPAAIAAAWRHRRNDPVRPDRVDTPLFVIPGAGGDMPGFAKLRLVSASLVDMRLLDYPDWTSLAAPHYGVSNLASELATRILAETPRRPIRVAGYSLGALVAWQVAANLHQQGHDVAFVGLIDCSTDPLGGETVREKGALRRICGDAKSVVRAVRAGAGIARVSKLFARYATRSPHMRGLRLVARLRWAPLPTRLRYRLQRDLNEALQRRIVRQWQSKWNATPRPADFPVVLFRASWRGTGQNHDLGWGRHCADLRVIDIEGEHLSIMADDRLPVLATRIANNMHRPASAPECIDDRVQPLAATA